MISIIGMTLVLMLCSCDFRIAFAAQETAGQVMPQEANKKIPQISLGDRRVTSTKSPEKSVPVPISDKNLMENWDRNSPDAGSLNQNHARLPYQIFGGERLTSGNTVHLAPPFPVSTPVSIVYPKKAVRKGWEGQTVVAAEVLPDGSVGRTVLAKSSGYEDLDNSARDAIKTWKFGVDSEGGINVPRYVDIPVNFKLKDES